MKVTLGKPRKHFEYLSMVVPTERICSVEGCEAPATKIQGFYLVVSRRVRVWVCPSHHTGSPLLGLPTPPSIAVALEKEAEYVALQEATYRNNAAPEFGVSVKVLASSGHGNPIPGDRVKAWRWGA